MRLRAAITAALLILLTGPAHAFRIVVISDLNGSYGSVSYAPEVHRAVEHILRLEPDVVVSTGDMVAGQRRPHLTEAEVRAMWRGFHSAVTEPLENAGIPLLVTPGNHDASAYGGFEGERRIFHETWASRTPRGVLGDWPFAYAVEMGGVRFVSLDATTVGALPRSQMRWLESLGDDGGPTVAFSHLPLHPFAQERETEIIGDPALGDIFEMIGTDMHLTGHHHVYYPGSHENVAFVAQACLGGGPRRLIGRSARAPKGFTVIDVEDDRMSVQALDVGTFDPIDLETLPESIGLLNRLDLQPTSSVSPGQ